jgi:hypothetical protein
VAQDSADESADGACLRGEGFLRDMADQSARAHTFDRRMRWFWLRRSLRDTSPAPEDVGDVGDVSAVGDAEGSVDLRDQPVVLTGEPAAALPVVPAPQAAPSARSAESPRLPRQRD